MNDIDREIREDFPEFTTFLSVKNVLNDIVVHGYNIINNSPASGEYKAKIVVDGITVGDLSIDCSLRAGKVMAKRASLDSSLFPEFRMRKRQEKINLVYRVDKGKRMDSYNIPFP